MSESFWVSDEGIRLRSKMLAQLIISRTYNKTLQIYGKEADVESLIYRAMPTACKLCAPFDGKIYRLGQFMKYLPVHPWCECGYEPFIGASWMGDFVIPLIIPIGV